MCTDSGVDSSIVLYKCHRNEKEKLENISCCFSMDDAGPFSFDSLIWSCECVKTVFKLFKTCCSED